MRSKRVFIPKPCLPITNNKKDASTPFKMRLNTIFRDWIVHHFLFLVFLAKKTLKNVLKPIESSSRMSDPLSQWRDWLKTLSLGQSFERRDDISQNEPRDSPPNQPLFKKIGACGGVSLLRCLSVPLGGIEGV